MCTLTLASTRSPNALLVKAGLVLFWVFCFFHLNLRFTKRKMKKESSTAFWGFWLGFHWVYRSTWGELVVISHPVGTMCLCLIRPFIFINTVSYFSKQVLHMVPHLSLSLLHVGAVLRGWHCFVNFHSSSLSPGPKITVEVCILIASCKAVPSLLFILGAFPWIQLHFLNRQWCRLRSKHAP